MGGDITYKTKHYCKRIHSSTNSAPMKASLKRNEGLVYQNLLDEIKKTKPNYKIHHLVRTTDLNETFSKGDTTDLSSEL